MTTRALLLPLRLTLVLILGLALTSSAFAHRLSVSEGAALHSFVLMGGSLEDLCDGESGTAHSESGCDACLLVDGFALAVDVAAPGAEQRLALGGVVLARPAVANAARWDLPCARAPPAVSA